MSTRIYMLLLSARPLGRLVSSIVAFANGFDLFRLKCLRLGNREAAEFTDWLKDALDRLYFGECDLVLARGTLRVVWGYGGSAHAQSISGTFLMDDADAESAALFLNGLCKLCHATYAMANREEELDSDHWRLGMPVSRTAFHDIFWFNYFGAEYKAVLPVSDALRGSVAQLIDHDDGSLLLLATVLPTQSLGPIRRVLAKQWPVFAALTPDASFSEPIEPDYSEVRNVPLPAGQFDFGATVFNSRMFTWLVDNGLVPPLSEKEEMVYLIREKYCRMLGIDPQDMLVVPMHRKLALLDEKAIDDAFSTLPETTPIRERVLAAHRKPLRGVSPKIVAYIQSTYFADSRHAPSQRPEGTKPEE